MRSRFAFFLVVASSSTLLGLAAACSSSSPEPAKLPLIEGGGGKKDTGDPFEEVDAEFVDSYIPPGTPGRVYAHTTDTLYLYEPVGGDLKEVGKFSCIEPGEVFIDLAVDRTGTMYATTFRRFLKVDPITAACTEIKKAAAGEQNFPNALSFVPAGTVDPTKETLVGYAPPSTSVDTTDYVRVDTATGAITKIGQLNVTGVQYKSSGDLISLIQDSNRTFLTVKLLTDAAAAGTDFLAEVDPKNGNLKKIIGNTNQTDLFGLGYWAGKGYGFSDNGRISQIDMTNGSATVVKTLTSADGGGVPWSGAGVTTEAPITE
jgi:hypothetical protein